MVGVGRGGCGVRRPRVGGSHVVAGLTPPLVAVRPSEWTRLLCDDGRGGHLRAMGGGEGVLAVAAASRDVFGATGGGRDGGGGVAVTALTTGSKGQRRRQRQRQRWRRQWVWQQAGPSTRSSRYGTETAGRRASARRGAADRRADERVVVNGVGRPRRARWRPLARTVSAGRELRASRHPPLLRYPPVGPRRRGSRARAARAGRHATRTRRARAPSRAARAALAGRHRG